MAIIITDFQFFTHGINCDDPALSKISQLARQSDFKSCRRIFAEYARNSLSKTFQALENNGYFKPQKKSDELKNNAELAVRRYMVSCKIPYEFDKEVIWESNPTENGYEEWPFQLSRHKELQTLSFAYSVYHDKRYLTACEELLESWIEQTQTPVKEPDSDCVFVQHTFSWRTIECGIRQGSVWPDIMHGFYLDFSDDVLCDFIKSVYEHGLRLQKYPTRNNWLIMEMTGLVHIAMLYPFLSDAIEWKQFALQKLCAELEGQFYPDGTQAELTTTYQNVTIANYVKIMKIFAALEQSVPEQMYEMIRKAILYYGKISAPDGKSPDINDGQEQDVKKLISNYYSLYENDPEFIYYLTGKGTPPTAPSYAFEYAGHGILRSGFDKTDCYVFFDGGEFGTAHQHEDKLNVLFFIGQDRVLNEAGNYAYDSSTMRHYVLSSAAHNTVLIDGFGQNRLSEYDWHVDLQKKSEMEFIFTNESDALRAEYHEGYGPDCKRLATHERCVYLVKKSMAKKPFLIVADRLYANERHTYQALWHLDLPQVKITQNNVITDKLNLFVDSSQSFSVTDIYGDKESCQGFICNSAIQGDYRPIHCICYTQNAATVRHITVLSPKNSGIVQIKASDDINDCTVTVYTDDGGEFQFTECFVPQSRS